MIIHLYYPLLGLQNSILMINNVFHQMIVYVQVICLFSMLLFNMTLINVELYSNYFSCYPKIYN
jgi:hypothetical protein